MDTFLDHEVTKYETAILMKVIENLIKQGKIVPTTDDILHELIRLSDIAMKHFPKDIN